MKDVVQSALVTTRVAWSRLRQTDRELAHTRRVMVIIARDRFCRHAWSRKHTTHLTDDEHPGDLVGRMTLSGVLRTLPVGERSFEALQIFEDLSVTETADLLNFTSGTVQSQTAGALLPSAPTPT